MFTYELLALSDHMQYIYAMGQLYSPGALFQEGIQYALDPGNEAIAQKDLEWFERCCGPYLPFRTGEKTILDRLGIVEAQPYARRFVAIGNSIHQRMLKPTHDWLMKILCSIPSDGTFDQTRPLDCMKIVTDVYSFDLKSATDRWPLTLLTALMTLLTSSRSLASAVAQTVLAFNTFVIDKPHVRKHKVLTFTAGQPLGYYGPWPLFTLSHHTTLWCG